jgi:hypothetical protein
LHEPLIRIAFDVELSGHYFRQIQHILVANMTLVWSRVHCNSLRTKSLSIQSNFYDIRIIASTGIPQGGDFINIYT